jgi:hypothetical protein
MASTAVRKTLGQSAPLAATDTVLYTVPANTDVVLSGIVICETGGLTPTIRVCCDAAAGTTTVVGKAIVWELPLAANSSAVVGQGITLAAGSTIIVRASGATVTFSAYGQENS